MSCKFCDCSALDNMPLGICIFDDQKRLVFCNKHYADLYALPRELTKPGTSLVAILEHRIAMGSSAASPEKYIGNRMQAIAAAGRRMEIIEQNDGRTIKILFYPLTGGGWVATHENVTEQRHSEATPEEIVGIAA